MKATNKKMRTILCLILISLCSPVSASIIRFDFRGFVTSSEIYEGINKGAPLTEAPSVNSEISGFYKFESGAIDIDGNSSYGHYDNILSLELNIGSLRYSYSVASPIFSADIRIENNVGSLNRDRYSVQIISSFNNKLSGPILDGLTPTAFLLSVLDFEGGSNPDLILDDSLLLDPPNFDLVTDYFGQGLNFLTYMRLQFNNGPTGAHLNGKITSLTKRTEIPEPNPAMLLLMGLYILIRKRTIYTPSQISS